MKKIHNIIVIVLNQLTSFSLYRNWNHIELWKLNAWKFNNNALDIESIERQVKNLVHSRRILLLYIC